jgi:hypothetical protein
MGSFEIIFRRCGDRIDCYANDFHLDIFGATLVLNQDFQDFQDER